MMNTKLKNAMSSVKLRLSGKKSKIVVTITAFTVVGLAILSSVQINPVQHALDKQSTGTALHAFDDD